MKKISHICFAISMISFIMLFGARYVLGEWQPFLFMPLVTFFIFLVVAVALNYRTYIQFLLMKTTRKGLNMGTLIVLTAICVGLVNYLGVRSNVNFDLTKQGLYSLSDQSIKTIESLTSPVDVTVFYLSSNDEEALRRIGDILKLFKNENQKLNYKFVNAYDQPDLANEYLKQGPVENQSVFAFVESNEKRIEVDHPLNEEQFTQAFVKLTRSGRQVVYATTGHHEWDISLSEEEPLGLGRLVQTLNDYSFSVEELSLTEGKVPEDASMVAILGPKAFFTEVELAALQSYIKGGGRLMIALDPGVPHNLTPVLTAIGVNFKSNYINDPTSAMGQMTIIAKDYSLEHPITKDFADRTTLFNLASEVVGLPDHPQIKVTEIVRSSPASLALEELKPPAEDLPHSSYSVAVAVEGHAEDVKTPFRAVVFGDSDFLRSELVYVLSNRDLVINSVAYLTQQKDLISIRPRLPEVNTIVPTRLSYLILVLGMILIPILLLSTAVIVWYRRRGR